MTDPVVHIDQLNLQYAGVVVLDQLDWQIHRGEHWLIGGKSGSGKSALAKALAGLEKTSGSIQTRFDHQSSLPARALYVSNWYQFTNLEGDRNFYYQQRYNKQQKNDTLTVYAELAAYAESEGLSFANLEQYLTLFEFIDLKGTQLIELSSGEHKKLQLIKALWLKPQLLIVDEPYTGLDKASRRKLNGFFDELAVSGVQLVLVTNETELPSCINRFAEVENGRINRVDTAQAFSMDAARTPQPLPAFLREAPTSPSDTMVHMENIHVRYGEKVVLKGINWTVKAGERWLLQGHNGSGKSTLLSLITGDHPQAYANNISLFGQPRGSGESIWEIKERIGIISPELHWYFDKTARVWQAVASGFYDSIGLFRQVSHEQQQKIDQLLAFFELTDVKDRLITTLPLGKQRLVLLARTMIKNPPLLILDEPCQGLDHTQTALFNAVVDELCGFGKTLIYVGHYETQLPSCLEKKMVLEKGEVKVMEETNELVC
ncbi:ATP-binding cassette domain-containing protein [Parapedobacter sp. 10938]|uniref:ATP-binding cassette domain-containing protein n=1 Tax=Parapedobacter flavus TaxID=3110225 RepID=UPI002DBE598C|nr:ATP-binding cassette domain-containing protein [Parapedobacter sp. 10938]MEC3878355.1 ATP-binding cassette domain-containing protein [Parapedobacter sp. 10938]